MIIAPTELNARSRRARAQRSVSAVASRVGRCDSGRQNPVFGDGRFAHILNRADVSHAELNHAQRWRPNDEFDDDELRRRRRHWKRFGLERHRRWPVRLGKERRLRAVLPDRDLRRRHQRLRAERRDARGQLSDDNQHRCEPLGTKRHHRHGADASVRERLQRRQRLGGEGRLSRGERRNGYLADDRL